MSILFFTNKPFVSWLVGVRVWVDELACFGQSLESESEVTDSDSRVLAPLPLAPRILIMERRMIQAYVFTVQSVVCRSRGVHGSEFDVNVPLFKAIIPLAPRVINCREEDGRPICSLFSQVTFAVTAVRSFSTEKDHLMLCTLCMCFFIYSGSVNPFPQKTQVYCFSSLCIFMCLDRSYLCLYPFPQMLQVQDLSSLCLIICWSRSPLHLYPLLQISQVWSLSSLCTCCVISCVQSGDLFL